VWVDTQGRLHLKITGGKRTWYCAEIVSKASLGHGLFTWQDTDPSFANREIDIEFSS
jgi:hypothetical protein